MNICFYCNVGMVFLAFLCSTFNKKLICLYAFIFLFSKESHAYKVQKDAKSTKQHHSHK